MLWDSPNLTIRILALDVPIIAITINEVLRVSRISNADYMAKAHEMDMIWL